MLRPTVICSLVVSLGMLGCMPIGKATTPVWNAKVVATYPHDPGAYTQGLIIENGQMFDGPVSTVTRPFAKWISRQAKSVGRSLSISNTLAKESQSLTERFSS